MSAKKGIITIGGVPGSGKSTASKAVAAQLGFEHFSSGDLMRELGAERNLHILDTNHAADDDEELDRKVDGRLKEIGETEDGLVIDSRMAWRWIKRSLKVYLEMPDTEKAAARILANMTPERAAREHIPSDPMEYAAQLAIRQRLESDRYLRKYGVDPFNPKNYDLVVNTATFGTTATASLIVVGFDLHQNATISSGTDQETL